MTLLQNGIYAPQDIRNGDFKLPPEKDNRVRIDANDSQYLDDANVPF